MGSPPEPAYVKTWESGRLAELADAAWSRMSGCELCPRRCGVDRAGGEKGFCRTGKRAVVGSVGPHFGEESVLVGSGGSGTIFFGGCNLLCRFCQNWSLSRCSEGEPLGAPALAKAMLKLQQMGCENVNLVTPSHVVPQFLSALALAVPDGLRLPIVYNTGGYDSVETLKLLDGVVDIYMPDLKMTDPKWCKELLGAADYWEVARAAALEMHRQVGDLVVDSAGVARRGLLVRHLVMPDGIAGTGQVMGFLAGEVSPDTYVNVMDQYRPVGDALGLAPIDRATTGDEYGLAVQSAIEAGIRRLD
jgi:putative pyruvate formate lyase activating enzyme